MKKNLNNKWYADPRIGATGTALKVFTMAALLTAGYTLVTASARRAADAINGR